MFKKLKALWHATVAVVIVCVTIVLLTVAVPVFIGLTAIIIMSIVGYITYKASEA
jgi:hypothetical protein